MNFKDQVIWITGASSGIGEALVYNFSKQGAKLIISARRQNELERVKASAANPDNINILPFDLLDVDNLLALAEKANNIFGRIDMLVNNGGISQRSLGAVTPLEIDRKIMEINFFSQVAITKAVLPIMIKQKSGTIVVTSSILGKIGVALRTAYASSKHALHGFFDSLREEIRHDNIDILLVCPGYIKTNVTFNALTETGEKYNKMADGQAKGMSAEACAKKIISAIRRKKLEVYIGGYETLTVYLKRYIPNIYLKLFRMFKST
jgi:short-subunit dehydrogenase